MMQKIRKSKERNFDTPTISVDKVADANTVVGKSIITVNGAEIIPLSSVTVVNLSGGGEYGDVKTFREADGFQMAGGSGTVITVKPKGFIIDDGKGCRLLKMNEGPIDAIIEKTGEFVNKISDNA